MAFFIKLIHSHILTLSIITILNCHYTSCVELQTKVYYPYKRLMVDLLRDIDTYVLPTQNISVPVDVVFSPYLNQILDLDVKSQVLTTKMNLGQFWSDPALKWNRSEYGGIRKVVLPGNKIWRPDIVLYNSVSEEKQVHGYERKFDLVVWSDGLVNYIPSGILQSACDLDLTYYPFDNQTCYLNFGSYHFHADEVNITTQKHTSRFEESIKFTESSEWHLHNFTCDWRAIRFSCCEETFNDIICKLEIHRRPLTYLFNLVMPCILLLLVGILVFCLPVDSGERVSLAITSLLAMMVFQLVVMDSIPPTSKVVPLLEFFLGLCMIILGLATFMACITVHMNTLITSDRRLPASLHTVLIKISPLLCIKKSSDKVKADEENGTTKKPNTTERLELQEQGENLIKTEKPNENNVESNGMKLLLQVTDRIFLIIYCLCIIILFAYFIGHSL